MKTPTTKESNTKVAQNGTADQAAQAAGTDAVVLGTAAGPVTPGGPGAGAAQKADVAEAVVTQPLTDLAAKDLGLRPVGDAGYGLSDEEKIMLASYRRQKAGLVIDANDVPGRRLAEAATYIKCDGAEYAPDGERYVPVDYKTYVSLREVGAIVDRPWNSLPLVGEAVAES